MPDASQPLPSAGVFPPTADGPVAVFDSGVGGLSVLRSLLTELPDERFVYMADSAHVPYGDRPQSFIVERTMRMARHAREVAGAKAFVIACNTATAAAVAQVRATWPDWVVVGIEPAVKPAALQTRSGVIGILATSNTLASQRFASLVEGFASDCRVVAQPCPGLVECIEAGDLNGPAVRSLLNGFVHELLQAGADVIVLGCTHYPFVAGLVAELGGPSVQVLETGEAVARETRRRLEAAGLLRRGRELAGAGGSESGGAFASAVRPSPPSLAPVSWGGRVSLQATGEPAQLAGAASRLLGPVLPATRVAC